MKILFIHPPASNITGRSNTNSPVLGVLYLTTILNEAGYNTRMLDADRLEMTWEELKNRLLWEKPDVIGLTSTTLGMGILYKTAELCREALPEAVIIAGGHGPTLEPEKTLKDCPAIDILGLNECELVIVGLINCLANKGDLSLIKGIAYRPDKQSIKINELESVVTDLDSLPIPNYDLMEPAFSHYVGVHGYWEGIEMPNAVMMGSRGCPHRCIFCCNANKTPRFRSAKNIVDEIEHYKKKFNIKSVQLYDNEFVGMTAAQNKWVIEICDEIISRGLNDLGYICQGRCSRFIESEVLKKMYEAGFRWIWWGVESGSQKILDRIQKDLRIEDVVNTFAITKKSGIKSLMFIMTGFPDETKEDFRATCRLIERVKPDKLRVHITTPLPGSKLYAELYKNNQIEIFDYSKYDTRETVIHRTNESSRSEIKARYQYLLFRYEFDRKYVIKQIFKLIFSIEGWQKLLLKIKTFWKNTI